MLKAELGDFLYIIIFAVLMLAGVFEKMAKAKRQAGTPRPPQPYDDFGNVEEQPASEQTPPQTLEEMMRRMVETINTPKQEEAVFYPEKEQSLEVIPTSGKHFYHPEEIRIREQSERIAFSPAPIEEEKEASKTGGYEFDIRQAIIASEILNRKY